MADEIPRAPAEGQEMSEDGRMARAPELSRDAWRDLFARLAAGDSSALEPMYGAAAGPVFGLALWWTGSVEDASDAVQEVFLRLAERHRRLGKVEDPDRGFSGSRTTSRWTWPGAGSAAQPSPWTRWRSLRRLRPTTPARSTRRAQQEKALSVPNRLASSDDRILVEMAVWSRDTKLTREYLKDAPARTLLPPPAPPSKSR
ncbi:MAG: hypothetical protein MUO25_04920 [Thermoanaerobaculaceae bacterium]|nr:hypothetical protein [Thermoanaerobaculaceae bacterium]